MIPPPRSARALCLLAVLMLVGLAACQNDADGPSEGKYRLGTPIQDSSYAAIVTSNYGSDTLTADALTQQVNRYMMRFPQLRNDMAQLRELQGFIVTEFVRSHVVEGETDRSALPLDTAMVAERFAQFRAQFPDEETFQSFQAQEGLNEDSLRGLLGDMVRQEQVIEGLRSTATEPTPDEIEAYRQEQAEQIRAQHILFLTNNVTEEAEREAVREQAEAVLDSIKAGADFTTMARRHSEDRASAVYGGDLNYFGRGQMVPPFEEAAFALADSGDVAPDLVETTFGYHIIRLTGRQSTPLMPEERAQQRMMETRQQEALETSFTRLLGENEVTVRVNPDLVQADINALPENT